jgi:hypothetical protein
MLCDRPVTPPLFIEMPSLPLALGLVTLALAHRFLASAQRILASSLRFLPGTRLLAPSAMRIFVLLTHLVVEHGRDHGHLLMMGQANIAVRHEVVGSSWYPRCVVHPSCLCGVARKALGIDCPGTPREFGRDHAGGLWPQNTKRGMNHFTLSQFARHTSSVSCNVNGPQSSIALNGLVPLHILSIPWTGRFPLAPPPAGSLAPDVGHEATRGTRTSHTTNWRRSSAGCGNCARCVLRPYGAYLSPT